MTNKISTVSTVSIYEDVFGNPLKENDIVCFFDNKMNKQYGVLKLEENVWRVFIFENSITRSSTIDYLFTNKYRFILLNSLNTVNIIKNNNLNINDKLSMLLGKYLECYLYNSFNDDDNLLEAILEENIKSVYGNNILDILNVIKMSKNNE